MSARSILPGEMPGADPATSNTLPGKAYTDATFLDLEIRELFHKTWHYAGWIGDLQDTGSYITASLMDQNVIIIRNRQGTLAGFHNVCQHRAKPIFQTANYRCSPFIGREKRKDWRLAGTRTASNAGR